MHIHLQSVIVALIFLGAAVMGVAIYKTRKITHRIKQQNAVTHTASSIRDWKVLSTLMSFFLLGYCLAAYLVITDASSLLAVLTGVVFFFGALFVLFSVSVYSTTLSQLITIQSELRVESNRANQAFEQLRQVQHSQMLTIHTEKMNSLGQMSAGIAHEFNNPIGFIYTNLEHVKRYVTDLVRLIDTYGEKTLPAEAVTELAEEIELDFVRTDIFKSLESMQVGSRRIRDIVKSMRNFSRLDESQYKSADLSEDIQSTLIMLQGKLDSSRQKIEIEIDYDPALPPIHCDHRAINQVLLHIIGNAIESFSAAGSARENKPVIKISTQQVDSHDAKIVISDNGSGISTHDVEHIFDPFFTTKPVGQGVGLGLSISYQIVTEQHRGRLLCHSQLTKGTTFTIELPIEISDQKTLFPN